MQALPWRRRIWLLPDPYFQLERVPMKLHIPCEDHYTRWFSFTPKLILTLHLSHPPSHLGSFAAMSAGTKRPLRFARPTRLARRSLGVLALALGAGLLPCSAFVGRRAMVSISPGGAKEFVEVEVHRAQYSNSLKHIKSHVKTQETHLDTKTFTPTCEV